MGIFDKFKSGFKKSASAFSSGLKNIVIKKEIDDKTLNKIEDYLIQSDVGITAASEIREIISQTLTLINSLLTTVAKVTLHFSGNKGWCSISGPIFFISKFSLLLTKKMTCGFPTFTAVPPV